MKVLDIAKRAGRNLRQAKLRTLFTSMAIGVGAFTIMMALAAGEGTRGYTDNLIQSNVDPQALFIVADKSLFGANSSTSSGLSKYDPDTSMASSGGFSSDTKALTQDDINKIAARDDIESVQPIYQLSPQYVQLEGQDAKYTAQISVYDPNVVPDAVSGALPQRGTDLAEGEIAVPASYAKELGVSEQDLIGKEIACSFVRPSKSLSDEELAKLLASGDAAKIAEAFGGQVKQFTFKIAATYKPSQLSFGSGSEPASSISAVDAEKIYEYTTKGTSGYEKYFGATAVVKDGTNSASVKSSLEKEGYGVQTTKDLQSLLFNIVNVLQGIVAGFGILALIASVFGIINTMYISVLERTNQIGLMRALGAPAKSIAKLFRYEAAWIGLLGGVIGILLALVTVLLLNPWINTALDLGEGNYLLEFAWWQAGLLLLGLIVVAIAAGWWPARKAAKLDPIEALRTE